jgi:hypothetical protein
MEAGKDRAQRASPDKSRFETWRVFHLIFTRVPCDAAKLLILLALPTGFEPVLQP